MKKTVNLVKNPKLRNIGIIGGGAAGFFYGINIAENSPCPVQVRILEATPRILTKVKISGGGRCNVTHSCFDPADLVKRYPRGSREMRGPFSRFGPAETIQWFEQRGVKLKTEPDGRMFPESNKSQTIIDCLNRSAENASVKVQTRWLVKSVERFDTGFTLTSRTGETWSCDFLILATGSMPTGHQLAKQLGHSITDLAPSLFTFCIKDDLFTEMAGTSFQNVEAKLFLDNKKNPRFTETGPMLITHWGLSGPAILKLSAFAARDLHQTNYQAKLVVNFLAGQNAETVEARLSELKGDTDIQIGNFKELPLTRKFWHRILQLNGIHPDQKLSSVAKKSLKSLAESLCRYQFTVNGKGEFKEEFVTAGGVKSSEVDFRTMESKICSNLFFAGEILDVDGITGGFNFQNAWTGGYIGATSIVERLPHE